MFTKINLPLDILPCGSLFKSQQNSTMPSFDLTFSVPGPSELSKLQNIIRLPFTPTVSVQDVEMLENHIHPLRLLKLSNGLQLILKSSPRPSTALLRRERHSLETEARVLTLFRQCANPCIPQLFHYDPEGTSLGSAFLLRQYIRGLTLHEMETILTAENRREIDRQLGRLANIIGKQVAASFGPLEKVASGTGSRSWRHAFITLFEGVLRDAEDMFIHLPYTAIRQEIARLASVLEEITLPQLVIVDFGRPSQVILDPESKQLSGVIDLGSAVWGDVLMAEVFEDPSPAVIEGFGSNPTNGRSNKTRLLLYVCPDGSSFPGLVAHRFQLRLLPLRI